MHYFDPARPKIAGRPAYANGLAALPSFTITPYAEGELWQMLTWVLVGRNRAIPKYLTLSADDLMQNLREYREDPEDWLLRKLDIDWTQMEDKTKARQNDLLAGLTLDDLL